MIPKLTKLRPSRALASRTHFGGFAGHLRVPKRPFCTLASKPEAESENETSPARPRFNYAAMTDLFNQYKTEVWGKAFPFVLGANVGYFLLYLLTDNNSWIDFAWFTNQFCIGSVIYNSTTSDSIGRSLVLLILFFAWAAGGAWYIFANRLSKRRSDDRMEKNCQEAGVNHRVYYAFRFLLHSVLYIPVATTTFFLFKQQKSKGWLYYIGIVLAIYGMVMKSKADQELQEFVNGSLISPRKSRGRRPQVRENRSALHPGPLENLEASQLVF